MSEKLDSKTKTLIANEIRKKQKQFCSWSDEELVRFFLDNNISDYKDRILKFANSIKKEINTQFSKEDDKFRWIKANENIRRLESLGFVVVYEFPEITKIADRYDNFYFHEGEKVCKRGTVLLHPDKSMYLVFDHILFENGEEGLSNFNGYMIVDQNECRRELISWYYPVNLHIGFVDILDDGKLMVYLGSVDEDYLYEDCARIVDDFLEKTCDFYHPLDYQGLHLNSYDPFEYNGYWINKKIEKRIENMSPQFQSYFIRSSKIKYKKRNVWLKDIYNLKR